MYDFYSIKVRCDLCKTTIYENKVHLDDSEKYDLPSGKQIACKFFRMPGWCLDCKRDRLIYSPYPVDKAINEISRRKAQLAEITSGWLYQLFGPFMKSTQERRKRLRVKIFELRNIIEFAKVRRDYDRQYCSECGSAHIIPLQKGTRSREVVTHRCGEIVLCDVDTGRYAWNDLA